MNFMVLLASSLFSLSLGALRVLFERFPFVPTVFDSTTTPADYYDFIVVGAGCGGSVVASRLSETTASVLLLEAGPSAPPETSPLFPGFITYFGGRHWVYNIKPRTDTYLGFVDNSPKMFSGLGMGGSSIMNGMLYTRGNKMDYDSWARLGNTGWDYDSVLPYFKKSENFHGPVAPENEKYHGRNGPLGITTHPVYSDLSTQFLEAGQQSGYKLVDPNTPYNQGFFPPTLTQVKGVRTLAAESFLGPVVHRSNLQIRTNAMVTKVLFNDKKRAIGVEYIIDGKRRVVLARKEVILSAGAVRSPQLLLLSGVGPREHLQEMGIPVVAHVPGVGRNLEEQPGIIIPFTVKDNAGSYGQEDFVPADLLEFISNGTGMFERAGGGNGWSLLNVGGGVDPSWPDVILQLTPGSYVVLGPKIMKDTFNTLPEVGEEMYKDMTRATSSTLSIMMGRSKSRGSISLQSTNPYDNPIIDTNMLGHPDDMKLFIKGIRKTLEILRTPALRDVLNVRLPDTPLSFCSSHSRDTDAYWECFIKYALTARFHLTTSTMMAPSSNPMGVVSPRLRVRGVTGLRVVDASAMPHSVSASPMATVYMVAEKAADMIREDWGYFTEFIS